MSQSINQTGMPLSFWIAFLSSIMPVHDGLQLMLECKMMPSSLYSSMTSSKYLIRRSMERL